MTLTVEDLRTAARVAEEKNYLGTRDMYLKEAAELEKKESEGTYLRELSDHAIEAWHNDNITGEYWVSITKAVVDKLTADGHLDLSEPVRIWKTENLDTSKRYKDCDGDLVEYRAGVWSYWWGSRNRWVAMTSESFAPYTLVQ